MEEPRVYDYMDSVTITESRVARRDTWQNLNLPRWSYLFFCVSSTISQLNNLVINLISSEQRGKNYSSEPHRFGNWRLVETMRSLKVAKFYLFARRVDTERVVPSVSQADSENTSLSTLVSCTFMRHVREWKPTTWRNTHARICIYRVYDVLPWQFLAGP